MSYKLEELATVEKYWDGIKRLIQMNIDNETFPCIVVMFDGNYDALRQVAKEMGLHTKKRRRKNARGLVVCSSPSDRRKVVVQKYTLGGMQCRLVEKYPAVLGIGRDFEIVKPRGKG